jgi:hypothetical protein
MVIDLLLYKKAGADLQLLPERRFGDILTLLIKEVRVVTAHVPSIQSTSSGNSKIYFVFSRVVSAFKKTDQ